MAFVILKNLQPQIKKAIELYFDKLDEMVADKRIDDLKSGKTTVASLEDVFKKAGIDI